MLDFTVFHERRAPLDDLSRGLTRDDLHRLTDEMVDAMLAVLATAGDEAVTYQPVDENAADPFARALSARESWTLGHIVVHTTASAEESSAHAASLARGVPVCGRSRTELPWQQMQTMAQLRHRLEESRRMRHGYLNAWPDQPDLATIFDPGYPGSTPLNAITCYLLGLAHDDDHLQHMRKVLAQVVQSGD